MTRQNAFFNNLEKTLARSKKNGASSSKFTLQELLEDFPEIANDLGSVMGFLSVIYDAPLPKDFESLSISRVESDQRYNDSVNDSLNNLSNKIVRTTPCKAPEMSPKHSISNSVSSLDRPRANNVDMNEMMEKLILTSAEIH